mgnify:CR=1 FL=1
MSFERIIGNDKVKQFLNKAINENHILHSYLFSGIQGIGKKLFAIEFAKKILCIEQNDEQENCLSCLKFKSSNHPDFMILEPENNVIKIEQIRNMQEKISEKPIVSKKKVYIIVDSDCMTKEAQNCLLKTLEEPPEYATIILTTANESKLLNTIKSRCIKVKFNGLLENEINQYLKQNEIVVNEENYIKISQGSIGKLLDIKEDEDVYNQVNIVLENIDKNTLIDILNKAEILYSQKDKIQEILDYINIYLYNTKDIRKINCIEYVEDTKKRLISNGNYDMCIDYLLLRMWERINYYNV